MREICEPASHADCPHNSRPKEEKDEKMGIIVSVRHNCQRVDEPKVVVEVRDLNPA